MRGYIGNILRIDLSTGQITREQLPEKTLREYVGGSGLGVKLLMDEAGSDVDPLGSENLLIFMTGPFTGTIVPASGRHQIIAKSPLTGIYGESDCGGTWGYALKKAGFDGIIVKGKAPKPIYILIDDGNVNILEASEVWGKDTYETDAFMKEKHGSYTETSCIGPAGENQVKLAAIMHNGKHGRAAGRTGLGAVMGSKNLKAIIVGGYQSINVYDEKALKSSIKEIAPTIIKNTQGMKDFGTAVGLIGSEKIGNLPMKNWAQDTWPNAEKISGQTMASTILKGRYYCKSCIVGCGREVEIKDGVYAGVDGAGPEYETLGTLGGACLIDDLEAIAYANELCNRHGIDTISVGVTISYAMELYEKGIITTQDLGGIALTWGNAEAMIELINKIARREGIGELLGNGVRYAAQKFGEKTKEFAMHVKGLEFPAYDPRSYNSLALGFATSNRGACHLQGASYFVEKAVTIPEIGIHQVLDRLRHNNQGKIQFDLQNIMCLMDSLKLCKFIFYGGVNLTHILNWYRFVTGWDIELDEFLLIGEKIFNLKRLYNNMCGISKADDTLPARILNEIHIEGGAAGNLPPLENMLNEYYICRGWDENGFPKPEKLEQLGLTKYL